MYLDVDGARFVRAQDYEQELDRLMAEAIVVANGNASEVRHDLDRMSAYVRSGIDRRHVRGLAMFSCSDTDMFEVFQLPLPVRSQVVVGSTPALGQLEQLVHTHSKLGVLLADRQEARVLVFEFGELVDHSVLMEELPRDYDQRGHRSRGDVSHHVAELTQQHFRHSAAAALKVFNNTGFDRIAIGAPDDVAAALERELHPYLTQRLTGRISVGLTSSLEEIRTAARVIEAAHVHSAELDLVDRLRGEIRRNGKGVAGLGPTAEALNDHRASHVIVSHGFSFEGWRCGSCGAIAAVGPTCRRCDTEMRRVADAVEEIVDEALAQGCAVNYCTDVGDLDVLGRIGALLRY